MTVNKSDIINLVSQTKKLNLSDTEYSIKKLIEYMSLNLYQGERIEIRGFGTFCIRDRKSIRARNPKSGESIELPKRSIPYFRASKLLKQRIN